MTTSIYCDCCGKSKQSDHTQCICGGVWDIGRNLSELDGELLRRRFDERLSIRSGVYASGVWRYHELIAPELSVEALITRGEGNTGLYEQETLTKLTGVRKLWFKAQSENPSGSFKDNGMVVAVSHGHSLGKRVFVCTSTGNTASSLAMYAAWIGSRSLVLAPSTGITPAKTAQSLAFGASIIPFEGTYDDGIRFLDAHAETLGLYVCNSINPYRLEGQKSIVFELAQQLRWRLPDWIVLPGGALSNVSALGKGLEELFALGIIDKLPRIALVQAEGASPFHRMMANNNSTLTPEPHPNTRASALNIGNPPNWRKASAAIHRTNGTTIAVSDEQIMFAKRRIDQAGIGCEPASAAALAGVMELRSQEVIQRDETVACILTGHLLKDVEAITEAISVPTESALLTKEHIAEALRLG